MTLNYIYVFRYLDMLNVRKRFRNVKAIVIDTDLDTNSYIILSKIAEVKGLKIEDVIIEAIENYLDKYILPIYKMCRNS